MDSPSSSPSPCPSPFDNTEQHGSDSHSNKRRRKKSIVWEHFSIVTINADCTRACCKHCKKSFAYITGTKLAGTSHLKRHMLGICPVNRLNQPENNQITPYTPPIKAAGIARGPPRKRYRPSSITVATVPFNLEQCRRDIAKMIILHEYPLGMVEHSGFIDFVKALQTGFNMASVNSIQEDCVGLFMGEKQRLLNLLGGIPGRVSLTVDLVTSDQSIGYVYLTGYFVDNDWKLQRRILNVIMFPFLDSEIAFNHVVSSCLTDWNLDNRLFTLTLDESFTNSTVRGNLRGLLSIKNPLILDGQLILGNCYNHVLTRLALDGLRFSEEIVKKVRDCVKYVKTSDIIEEKFVELREQLQVPSTKTLILDDKSRWDSTYLMLEAASDLKEVFLCLDNSNPNYKQSPSMEDWKQVESLCIYLKLLFDAANILTSPKYPSSDTFFHEVWKIQLELMHTAMSQDPFVRALTRPLHETFDKYWKESSLILAVAVIMDPRFKMKLVEFSFSRIYGEDADTWIRIVDEGVHELYLEYVVQCLPPPTFVDIDENGNENENENVLRTETNEEETLSDFDVYISEIMSTQQMKSELDQYLEESLLPRTQEFDVLGWWKVNRHKYPTLSKMASDVLCIPVSTMGPECVFDTESKKMDKGRSSLNILTLEAIICAKDWLQYGCSESWLGIPTAIVKMEC